MAKKRKSERVSREGDHEKRRAIRQETKHSLLAVFSFVFALILILAFFNKAGVVGSSVEYVLHIIFGAGFVVTPLLLVLSGVSFLRSGERRVVATTLIGGTLALVSVLGLFEAVLGSGQGGYVGWAVAQPLVTLFDFWATVIILGAILCAALIIMFDISLKFRPRFISDDDDNDEVDDASEAPAKMKLHIPQIFKGKTKDTPIDKKEDEDEEEGSSEDEVVVNTGEDRVASVAQGAKKKNTHATPTQSYASLIQYSTPPLEILEDSKGTPSSGDIKANANIIKRTLANFGINVEMGEVNVGPSVTQYTLKPAEGIKVTRITALQDDLALALAAHPLRIEAPIPGKSLVGIEVPNRSIALVGLRSILGLEDFQNSAALTFAIGRDVGGKAVFSDIAKLPHLLIAGATGSGKSIMIHTLLISLLYKNSPQFLRFIMIDPKRVELTVYNKIPHLLTPVITDPKKAVSALRWGGSEMERRYEKLEEAGVRNIASYNDLMIKEGRHAELLPYIIVVIDELADLMTSYPREMEASIVRLAQKSRAVGIHLIVSTQRPSVEVITGLIKANITARLALQVVSGIDSRTILDMTGAEDLLGNGDLLYLAGDSSKPRRIQGAFISEKEVKAVAGFLFEQKDQFDAPISLDPTMGGSSQHDLTSFDDAFGGDGDDDPVYEEARIVVMEAGRASTSFLQRRLKLGYARAARIMDLLEERGIVGPGEGAKPREVLARKDSGGNPFASNDNSMKDLNSVRTTQERETPYTDFDS